MNTPCSKFHPNENSFGSSSNLVKHPLVSLMLYMSQQSRGLVTAVDNHFDKLWLQGSQGRHKNIAVTSLTALTVFPSGHRQMVMFRAHSAPRLMTLQWRHNERNGVSNHRSFHYWLNHFFGRRSKKTSKLRGTGLCEGNSPVTREYPEQRASNAERFSFDDVIMEPSDEWPLLTVDKIRTKNRYG